MRVSGGTDRLPFEDAFADRISHASAALFSKPVVTPGAIHSAQQPLMELLCGICARPLLAAFRVARDADARRFLAASDSMYRNFIQHLREGGLQELFHELPELGRLVELCVEDWEAAMEEFLLHLDADREHMIEMFGHGAAGEIVGLDTGLSDRHAGRAVIRVTFASGLSVIYKPRDMTLERSYFELLKWLNENGAPIDHRVVKILQRPSYGWAECVHAAPCRNEQEVHDFFRRAGSLHCLLYVLHATDAHMGNVLAVGAHPVLVDAECLMQPRRFGISTNSEGVPDEDEPEDLLASALLPRPRVTRAEGPDFSGLGGNAGQPTDFRVPLWRNANRDDLSLRFVSGELTPQENLPVLEGQQLRVEDHPTEFLEGFGGMHRFLELRRDSLLQRDGPLAPLLTAKPRVLLRSTRFYTARMNRSLHPRYLRDTSARLQFLRAAAETDDLGLTPQLAAGEAQEMMMLNVPYFSAHNDDLELEAKTSVRHRGYFSLTGRQVVEERLRSLGESNLIRHTELLRSLFLLSTLRGIV